MKNIGIFCSSSSQIDPKYLNEGRAIGEAIGKAGKTMVYGGTDFGLMKAVADAAHETGGRLVGVVPKLLEERGRAHTALDEKILVDDLSERKRVMVERSDILLCSPAGSGRLTRPSPRSPAIRSAITISPRTFTTCRASGARSLFS